MEKKYILYLTSFSNLEATGVTLKSFFAEVSKKFNNFYIINTDSLKNFKNSTKKHIKEIFFKFSKKIKFFSPKNFMDFNYFLDDKLPIIINNFGRRWANFRLLFFIARKKIPQILVTHTGTAQALPDDYFKGKKIYFLRYFFYRFLHLIHCHKKVF